MSNAETIVDLFVSGWAHKPHKPVSKTVCLVIPNCPTRNMGSQVMKTYLSLFFILNTCTTLPTQLRATLEKTNYLNSPPVGLRQRKSIRRHRFSLIIHPIHIISSILVDTTHCVLQHLVLEFFVSSLVVLLRMSQSGVVVGSGASGAGSAAGLFYTSLRLLWAFIIV